MAELSDYSWLTSDEASPWLARFAEDERPPLELQSDLRRELSSERARLIAEQLDLRRKAVEKFGERAARMFFHRVRLEQATDFWIARYKASRVPEGATIADYCCGIGGDLLALAERGAAAGWDNDEIACRLARANVPTAAVTCGDVERKTPDGVDMWHLDPDRRDRGRRSTTVAAYAPGPELVDRWLAINPCGAVKLAPAGMAPTSWASHAELEWITRDRQCRQQVAWFGPLATAPGRRRATRIMRSDNVESFVGDPVLHSEPAAAPGRFVFDPDASVLAADLLGAFAAAHNLSTLGPGGAYLTGDAAINVPLATRLAVRDSMPLRPALLAKYLGERRIGTVEIKKRGVAIDPETLRRQLKLRGDGQATLVLTRIGRRELAIVAERVSA